MVLNEAEIQVLTSICAAEHEGGATDRASIEDRGDGYWIYKEDWSEAYDALVEKGLVRYEDSKYRLSDSGRPVAEQYYNERPDMYWYFYQTFYSTARASPAYTALCEDVFGRDLCQDGQTDMVSLDELLGLLHLREGDKVLDLGCGAGVISEYISDQTGAHVTGIDYSETAIADAQERTREKHSKLEFVQGNFNALSLESTAYDAVVSLDTLYWAADLDRTLSMLAGTLNPGGQMGIFMNHHIGPADPRTLLAVENTDAYIALQNLTLPVETYDYTDNIKQFWRRMHTAVTALQGAFAAEGNTAIAARLLHECEDDYLPDVDNDRIARYLFHVRLPV